MSLLYREAIARIAREANPVRALGRSKLDEGDGMHLTFRGSERIGWFMDFLVTETNEIELDPETWEAFAPAMAYYAALADITFANMEGQNNDSEHR
jgi:hypothetical protein